MNSVGNTPGVRSTDLLTKLLFPAAAPSGTVSSEIGDQLLQAGNQVLPDSHAVPTIALPIQPRSVVAQDPVTSLPATAATVQAGSAAGGLVDWVNKNPVPALAVGAGLAYLLYKFLK